MFLTFDLDPMRASSVLWSRASSSRFSRRPEIRIPLSKLKQPIPASFQAKPSAVGASILDIDRIYVTRQIEMMNVFLGYEQANRYTMQTDAGPVGYICEIGSGIGSMILRQLLRTRRYLNADVLDTNGSVVYKVRD